jgi:O-antigen/teichoic acid export membrane protein
LALSSEQASRVPSRLGVSQLWQRLKARFGDAEQLLMQRLAGTVFLIRVVGALLAYVTQILFARWMGSFEFGIYVYVWTWVLLLGQLLDLGLGTAAQKFIPEYRERNALSALRGFLSGSRWLTFGFATAIAVACAGLVRLLQPWLDDYTVIPLYIACLALPAYALSSTQDGIARSFDWVGLGLVPTNIVRQLLLTVLMATAYFAALPMDGTVAIVVAALSIWLPTLGQMLILNRRLSTRVEAGPKTHHHRIWLGISLPILAVESFYVLLAYSDILVLQQFRPPDEVAVYYAAAKTLALVAAIYYAVSATAAHRFSAYQAAGDRPGLSQFVTHSIHLTFWPSLAATLVLLAFGRQILSLFGAQFVDGYYLMFILCVGMLARSSIGPIERLLNMLGEQRICAMVYGGAFALNLVLCVAFIPPFGAAGAAMAISATLVVESILLFIVTKRRLGLHAFIWSRAAKR